MTGEMAQRLRVLAALTEDPGSVSSTHRAGSQQSATPPLPEDLEPFVL